MEIIYKDNSSSKNTNIQYDSYTLSEFISIDNRIGRGTYCIAYKINDKVILKFYPAELNFDNETDDFSVEIKSEIEFIKKNNNLDVVANTYLIASDTQKNLYIVQEYLKSKPITNILFSDFIDNLSIYIKILHMNIQLLEKNYVNIDIKPTNFGYDKNGNYKLFDMNLLLKLKKKRIRKKNKFI